ncbi:MAG: cytochrome, partial [Caulobacteraceae bacterium]|nr:cytochrome [Caulobacteraceae bacterium]
MRRAMPDPAPSLFRPAAPEQTGRWPSLLDMLVGETAKNPLVGWPAEIFDGLNRKSRFLHLTYHGISDPEGIRHVLLDNVANYQRPRLVRAALAPMLGEGLLTAEGAAWREQRRLMAP